MLTPISQQTPADRGVKWKCSIRDVGQPPSAARCQPRAAGPHFPSWVHRFNVTKRSIRDVGQPPSAALVMSAPLASGDQGAFSGKIRSTISDDWKPAPFQETREVPAPLKWSPRRIPN